MHKMVEVAYISYSVFNTYFQLWINCNVALVTAR